MSHPPKRLLAELARTLSKVDPEAAVHVEYCPACGVRFAAVLSLLGDAEERSCGRPVLAARHPRRGALSSRAARSIHPAEGSLVAFARTLVEMNEKVFEHVRFCTPCLWQVAQTMPARAARRPVPPCNVPAPREGDEDASLLAELVALPAAERETRLLAEVRFHRRSFAEALRREARRHLARDPRRAEDLARLALLAAGASGAGRDAAGLLGGTWAEMAEARRRQEDFDGAEQALDLAASYESGAEASGERWFLLAELRRDQGRTDEALALYRRARACFDTGGAVERQAVASMRAAGLHFAERRPAEALALFDGACALVSRGLPAGLALRAAQGKVSVLASAGRHAEGACAGKIAVLCLADAVRRPPEPARGGWTAAFADGGAPARERLWVMLAESVAGGRPWEAALLGLDFAAILAEDGAAAELARLAVEVSPLALPGGLPPRGRNLLAGLLAAVERGSATVDQIRHAADAVALCWTEPELALGA